MAIERQPKPRASNVDAINAASNIYHDRKKLHELRELNARTQDLANQISRIAVFESSQRSEIIREARASNDLLSDIIQQNQMLTKQQDVALDLSRASLEELQTISTTFLSIKRKENADREQRLALHEVSLRMNDLDEKKREYPEWSLYQVEVLYQIIEERNVSISDFSASFSDLNHAQSCFDRLSDLRDELVDMNGGAD